MDRSYKVQQVINFVAYSDKCNNSVLDFFKYLKDGFTNGYAILGYVVAVIAYCFIAIKNKQYDNLSKEIALLPEADRKDVLYKKLNATFRPNMTGEQYLKTQKINSKLYVSIAVILGLLIGFLQMNQSNVSVVVPHSKRINGIIYEGTDKTKPLSGAYAYVRIKTKVDSSQPRLTGSDGKFFLDVDTTMDFKETIYFGKDSFQDRQNFNSTDILELHLALGKQLIRDNNAEVLAALKKLQENHNSTMQGFSSGKNKEYGDGIEAKEQRHYVDSVKLQMAFDTIVDFENRIYAVFHHQYAFGQYNLLDQTWEFGGNMSEHLVKMQIMLNGELNNTYLFSSPSFCRSWRALHNWISQYFSQKKNSWVLRDTGLNTPERKTLLQNEFVKKYLDFVNASKGKLEDSRIRSIFF